MKKAYIVLLTIVATALILNGCSKKEDKIFGDGETGEVVDYTQANCEKSGGTFADGACACSEGFTYNEKSGLCTDSTGTPGGEFGVQVKSKTEAAVQ